MYERLIIDGNSVYEVDEECLKHRNVPAECRVTEEGSASSSRFRRHCIRIRCCFRRKIHFRSRREEG